MISPGVKTLATLSITSALAGQVQTVIDGLEGMMSANILAEAIGFTGGTSIDVVVRMSRDDGTTWLDVAHFAFSGPGKKYCNLQRFATKAITSYAALSGEGINDSLFGDRYDCVITTVGTFVDTNVKVTLDAA